MNRSKKREKEFVFKKAFEKAKKRAINRKRSCVIDGCENTAINSHILQQHGVLSNILENNHLIQFDMNSAHNWSENDRSNIMKIRQKGVKKALSYPIFCSEHDDRLFREIEKNDVIYDDYHVQLLFCYRSCCCEKVKKTITKEINEVIVADLGSNENLSKIIKGMELAIKDMSFYMSEFEKDLDDESRRSFEFRTFEVDVNDICVSTVLYDKSIEDPSKDIFEQVFFQLIPLEDHSIVIIGYHKDYSSHWINHFVDEWIHILTLGSLNDFDEKISDMITRHTENWGMSISLFNQLSDEKKQLLVNEFHTNYPSQYNPSKINLFEGID